MLTLTSNVNTGITTQNNQNLSVIFKIELDGGIVERWSYIRPVTVSGDGIYNDKIIKRGNLGSTNKSANFEDGGGLGSIDTISIIFKKGNNFNDYYPGNSNYLINRKISIGIVYGTSVASTDITWFYYGRIRNLEYNYEEMRIDIDDYMEFFNYELPFYSIQTTNNDGVSYFPNAPKEHIDKPIPIIYGDFIWDSNSLLPKTDTGVPVYTIDKKNYKQIACSHSINPPSIHTTSHIYNDQYGCYIRLRNYNINNETYLESSINSYSGAYMNLLYSGIGLLVGHVSIYPKYPSPDKNISDTPEFGENGLIQSINLANYNEYITFKMGGGNSSPTLGALAGSSVQKITRVTFYADMYNSSVNNGKVLLEIIDPSALTYQSGPVIAYKSTNIPFNSTLRCAVDLYDDASPYYQIILANYSWNWLNAIIFKVKNDLAGGNLLILNCYVRIINFLIGEIESKWGYKKLYHYYDTLGSEKSKYEKRYQYTILVPTSDSGYMSLGGYTFKDWID